MEGWLEKVELPAAATVVAPGGAAQAGYRRSLTCTYVIDPQNPKEGDLRTVADSVGTVWLENVYDARGRVEQQLLGQDSCRLRYLPTRETEVDNLDGGTRNLSFAPSPLADATTPTALVDENGRRDTFEHNTHGLLIRRTVPGGEEIRRVFDELATDARRRANMLAERHVGAAAASARPSISTVSGTTSCSARCRPAAIVPAPAPISIRAISSTTTRCSRVDPTPTCSRATRATWCG